MLKPLLVRSVLVAAFAAILVAGCEQTSGIAPTSGPMLSDVGSSPALPQFNDVFVPAGAKLYVERTIVLGENPWYGQLALGTSNDPPALFEQYRRDMVGLGWQEVTSIRAQISTLTFMREDRVATVQIQASRLRGSEITITVSPRGTGAASGATGRGGPIVGGSRPAPVQRQ